MEKIDILIIGAGVVGLAIAQELSEENKTVALVEKNKAFGQETSSRNSEVIHAGMYYPKDSLKARLCVEGRKLLYELCRQYAIPFKKIGKLIVATAKEEVAGLDMLFHQGRDNGVEGLKMLAKDELSSLEPNLRGMCALHSAETGIIDSHRLMQYFLNRARDNGVMVVFNSEAVAIEKISGAYKAVIKNGLETTDITAGIVINCAGLDADTVAAMAGMDIESCNYRLHYCKGQYFRLSGNGAKFINRLVYPVPKPKSGGLGIHITLDIAGSMRLGPDDEYLKDRCKDYGVDVSRRRDFYSSVKQFLPFIEENQLQPDTSGIRPKLQGKNEPFRDFVIREEADRGFPGFINLIGIESPGLTASLAISRYVRKKVLMCS